jgi:sec-independent protein translocase protein TatC
MAEHADDKRMELTEHLQELRTRIMRSLIYLVLASILAYVFFNPIYDFLSAPLKQTMHRVNEQRIAREVAAQGKPGRAKDDIFVLPKPIMPGEPVTAEKYNELVTAVDWVRRHPISVPVMGDIFHNFTEMFLVQLQVSILIGFILAIPLVIWELAQFVTPALTREERRPLRVLIPISVFLIACGVTVAYYTLFFAMAWFVSFLDAFSPTAALLQGPNDYVMFFIKMMAAFALAFQLPVVLMAAGFLGLVSSKALLKNWRWGIVLAALGGLLTPSNDLPSMALMAIPLLILYFLSIVLVKLVENWKEKDQAKRH